MTIKEAVEARAELLADSLARNFLVEIKSYRTPKGVLVFEVYKDGDLQIQLDAGLFSVWAAGVFWRKDET